MPPHDRALFSAQTFLFGETSQNQLSGLLLRGLSTEAGDRFDNATAGGSSGWARAGADWLNGDDPFRATDYALEAGADAAVGPGGRLGVAIGYDSADFSDSAGGSASQESVHVSLYGSEAAGGAVISAAVSYAHAWNRSDRPTGIGAVTASWGSDAFTGGVQIAAPLSLGAVVATPMAGLVVSNVTNGAFGEHDGRLTGFAVRATASSFTGVEPYAALDLARPFKTAGGTTITPNLMAGFRYDQAAASGGDQTLVAADGTVFVGNRLNLDPNTAILGAGLSARKSGLTGFVRYRATLSSNWNDQSVSAGVRFAF